VADFAIIQNGVVVNVIVADEGWPEGVNITTLDPKPAIGWTFENGVFAAPPVEPAPEPTPAPTHTNLMTHLAFLERMTPEEYGRFETFLASSVEARFAKAKFDMARDVNVLRTDVQTFAYTLRAVGVLLSDERVAALLALKPLSETGAINPLTGAVTP
jgi:hypothetical protein